MAVGHNDIIIIITDIVKGLTCIVPVLYQPNILWDTHNVLPPASNVLPTDDIDFL